MDIKTKIAELIKTAAKDIGAEAGIFSLEHPEIMAHGDLASNVALILSKQLKKSPVEVANLIVPRLEELAQDNGNIQKISIAGPGFINFYLTDKVFTDGIGEILEKKDRFGTNNILNGRKTTVEYTDPNPFKEFHIGHLMTNVIGEALSRLEAGNGAVVTRACYQGDVGLHVAKAIWGAQKMMQENPAKKRDFFGNLFGFGKKPKIWGQAYAYGATKYEEDETVKKEIIALNKVIYERTNKSVNEIYDVGRKVSLQEFEKIYKILGTKFDKYFFESLMAGPGKELVEKNIKTGIFEESDGAVVFKGEKYGLHTRVFINSEGLPTYEAKELALAKIKYDETGYDKSIVVTGNEINDYYKVVMKALEQIYPDLAKRVLHVGHGMLRLPTGKMSSRTGKVISGEFLLNEIKKLVLEKMKEREMGESEKAAAAGIIAVGALKYSILKQAAGSDIIFDFDKSVSFDGDSGPYLQYSVVRAKSVLEKAKKEGMKMSIKYEYQVSGIKQEAGTLEKLLARFPEAVARAGSEYSPHHLVSYLIELAGAFNSYYANTKIVDKTDPLSGYRLALTAAFAQVMTNGLDFLGIKVPSRM